MHPFEGARRAFSDLRGPGYVRISDDRDRDHDIAEISPIQSGNYNRKPTDDRLLS
jgi:hypothetical protein